MANKEEVYYLLFDVKLKRPGCVLLQAIAVPNFNIAKCFNVESWLLAPTPDMKVYKITNQQLKQLAHTVNTLFPSKFGGKDESTNRTPATTANR